MRNVLVLLLAAAFPLLTAKATTSQTRLAVLQEHNIFHSGLTGLHTVALTFDDGPNAHTAEVLDVLKANHIPATFFIVGRMAHLHPGLLRRMAAEGHLLANHSASHTRFDEEYAEDPQLLADELRDVDDQIRPLMPDDAKFFFRAPYGIWRPDFAQLLNADRALRQYVGPVYWDVGGELDFDDDGNPLQSADWQCWDAGLDVSDCAQGYVNEIGRKDGGVVLMHCIHAQSAALLNAILPRLLDGGFAFVRLDDVSAYRQFEAPPPEAAPVAVSSR